VVVLLVTDPVHSESIVGTGLAFLYFNLTRMFGGDADEKMMQQR
jgi:hypothetical protein